MSLPKCVQDIIFRMVMPHTPEDDEEEDGSEEDDSLSLSSLQRGKVWAVPEAAGRFEAEEGEKGQIVHNEQWGIWH